MKIVVNLLREVFFNDFITQMFWGLVLCLWSRYGTTNFIIRRDTSSEWSFQSYILNDINSVKWARRSPMEQSRWQMLYLSDHILDHCQLPIFLYWWTKFAFNFKKFLFIVQQFFFYFSQTNAYHQFPMNILYCDLDSISCNRKAKCPIGKWC